MVNRRNLKETIHTGVEEMLFSLSILHAVASEERRPAIEELISKVIGSENDSIAHTSHTDDRGETKFVRKYYNKLQEECLHFANEIEDKINKFGDELLTPET